MQIFLVTISSDYRMSDHWASIVDSHEKSDTVTSLADWHYDNNEMTVIVTDADKMMHIAETLKGLGIEHSYKNILEQYSLFVTNAPDSYDGFGTLTISKNENQRTVAILKEHKNWQSMRYGSGLYFCAPVRN